MTFFSPTKNWINFCALLIALFLIKGVIYMSITPPFEGWDEYQHLAYISYLDEYQERPVLNKALVSPKLLEKIIAFPVPQAMQDQVSSSGTVTYKTFYDQNFSGTHYKSKHPDINLYQAQHGSFYYRLMLPVTKLFDGKQDILDTIYILRLINIIFITVSLILILYLLKSIVFLKSHAAVLAMLIISQPLLLINGCRIANDPLAIMTATGVAVIGLLDQYRKKILFSIISGILLGIACWTKSTAVIMFPFWFLCLGVSCCRKEISFRKMILLLGITYTIALIILKQYLFFNLENYGMLFVMQEAIVNKNNGQSILDMLNTFIEFPVILDNLGIWLKNIIWVGGWSFLQVQYITKISFILLLFSITGWLFGLSKKSTNKTTLSLESSLLCLSLVVLTSMALSWHYIQSALAWGQPTTCPWYTALSIPFFLIYIYDGASRWSARTGLVVVSLLILLYIYADIRGLVTMISFYSGGTLTGTSLINIATIHPVWLGTPVLLFSVLIFVSILVLLLKIILGITYNFVVTDDKWKEKK